jgi:ATP-dependent Clp protease ATP-binding subunit ClpA
MDYLVRKGFDSKMGARPLQRTIDDVIKRPLSKEILFGKLTNGGLVEITLENDQLKMNFVDPLPVKNKNELSETNDS